MNTPYTTMIKITDTRFGVNVFGLYSVKTMHPITEIPKYNIYQTMELLAMNPNNYNIKDIVINALTETFGRYGFKLEDFHVDIEFTISEDFRYENSWF